MKVLVTGAHFTPALAVINELQKNYHAEIVYVGRNTTLEGDETPSVESQILPKLRVKFVPIIAGRLQRTLTIYTIPSLLKIPVGFLQSLFIILSERPDVILSFGGYVSVPIVLAGWLFSIPIITHEQTLVPSLSNRINSLFAQKVALAFERGEKNPKRIVTGNPIRAEILDSQAILPKDYQDIFNYSKKMKLPIILIMGGNQGSHIINITVEKILQKLIKIACIIVVTGENKFGDFERIKRVEREGVIIRRWIGQEFGAVLSNVDLVISRAGINSLVELAYLGKPALVIPLPFLTNNEQQQNANYFQKLGLVKILPQAKLSKSSLFTNVKIMLRDLTHLKKQSQKTKKLIIPDAAKRLALETMLLSKVNL